MICPKCSTQNRDNAEICSVCKQPLTAPPPPPGQQNISDTAQPPLEPKTSGLAIASLVLGIVGTVGILMCIGWIAGIYLLYKVYDMGFVDFLILIALNAGFWFVFQFMGGLNSVGSGPGGVAFWAHVGGFLAGMMLIRLWTKRFRRPQTYWE